MATNSVIAMGQGYKIMPVKELIKIINENTVEEESQIDFNEAFIYHLSNKKDILIPNVGAEGILFDDPEELRRMILERRFPVKGDGTLFEQHNERLEKIEENIDFYFKQLEKLLGVEIVLKSDDDYLIVLSDSINSFLRKRSRDELFVPLGIFFYEMVRKKINGNWRLDREYILNSYVIPYVSGKDNATYIVWPTLYDRLGSKPFSCSVFLKEVLESK